MESNVREVLGRAVQHHRAGELSQARELYLQTLEIHPDHPDALHLLGVISHQLDDSEQALAQIRRAIALQPDQASFHSNLGVVLRGQERLEEAAQSLCRAIELDPELADAHYNLGRTRRAQQRLGDAIDCYREATRLRPDYVDALNSLGLALVDQDDIDEAITCYRRVRQLNPKHVQAVINLGAAHKRRGRFEAAEECYRQAIQMAPRSVESQCNLGNAYRDTGRLEEARQCFETAFELQPSYEPALIGLGNVCKDLGRVSEAEKHYRQATAANSDSVEALHALGDALCEQGQIDQAAGHFRRILELDPDASLMRLRLDSLCPTVFFDVRGINTYREELMEKVIAHDEAHFEIDLRLLDASNCHPSFNLPFHGLDDRPLREAYARLFAGRIQACFPRPAPMRSRRGNRVGFVVTARHEDTFCRSLGGVIDRLDRERFEIVVLCAHSGESMIRESLTNSSTCIVPFPARFDRIEATIRDARCDLLYFWEIGTDSTNYFLPFFSMAPIQCTSWGIQVTSGIPTVDHYLSSKLVETADAASHYTEQLVLADTLLTYQFRGRPPGRPKSRADFGFPDDRTLYVCAQQIGKIHPDFDLILADILNLDPLGLIAITSERRGRESADQLRRRWRRTIPDAAERIEIIPHQTRDGYLSLVQCADALLDPLHFGGVNSTYDALSLHRPIITLPSHFQRGRYTYGCYKKMGLNTCIAKDARDYAGLAVRIANDSGFRDAIIGEITARSPCLFEDVQAVREHERIFSELLE